MKVYYKTKDVLNYCSSCPICGQNVIHNYNYFNISKSDLDIRINVMSNMFDMEYTQTSNIQPIYELGGHSYTGYFVGYSNNKCSYVINGNCLHTDVVIACDCGCYDYKIEFYFNLANYLIDKIIINSEMITIDDRNLVHIIENYYGKEPYTLYKLIEKNKCHDIIKLPPISNNLFNSDEILNRIKKLLIFS